MNYLNRYDDIRIFLQGYRRQHTYNTGVTTLNLQSQNIHIYIYIYKEREGKERENRRKEGEAMNSKHRVDSWIMMSKWGVRSPEVEHVK